MSEFVQSILQNLGSFLKDFHNAERITLVGSFYLFSAAIYLISLIRFGSPKRMQEHFDAKAKNDPDHVDIKDVPVVAVIVIGWIILVPILLLYLRHLEDDNELTSLQAIVWFYSILLASWLIVFFLTKHFKAKFREKESTSEQKSSPD